MSQIGLSNPTFRNFPQNPRNQVIQLLRQNPRVVQAIRNFQTKRRDQLGLALNTNYDFSGGGSYAPISTSNSPGKFETIFNGALSIGSQIIGAFGKNQTTQVVANKGQVTALQTPYGSAGTVNTQAQAEAAAAAAAAANNAGAGALAVNAGSSFFDGLAKSFGISTSTLMLLGIGGAYLLFRTPPKSR